MSPTLKNKFFYAALIILLVLSVNCEKRSKVSWIHEGDLVFQRRSEIRYKIMDFLQSSYYNHVGIIVKKQDRYFVISAEATVKEEDLNEWLARGDNKHFMILRPSAHIQPQMDKVIQWAQFYKGRVYDYSYDWDDHKIYNAELIQKAFIKGAGIYPGDTRLVDSYFIAPEDTTLFHELKDKIPYRKEVVTVESIISSGYLKNILKN